MEPKRKTLGHEVIDGATLPGARIWKIFETEIQNNAPELTNANLVLMWRTTFNGNSEGSTPHGTVHILGARDRCLAVHLGGDPVDAVIVLNRDVWEREKEQALRGMALDLLRYIKPSLTAGGDDQVKWDDSQDSLVWAKRQPVKLQPESVAVHGPWSHEVRGVSRAIASGAQIDVPLAEPESDEDQEDQSATG